MSALYNERFRAYFIQAFALVAVIALFVALGHNAAVKLEQNGIASGFGFLNDTAGYQISMALIDYSASDTHWDAYLVGLLNTLLIAVLTIISATSVGLLVALGRLSSNWVLSRLCYCFLEYFRNVPILVHLFIIYGIVLILPPVRKSWTLFDSFYLSNRGFVMPKPGMETGFSFVILTFVAGIALAYLLARRSKETFNREGKRTPFLSVKILGLALLPATIVFFALGAPLSWSIPVLKGFNLRGGLTLSPEFCALWLAGTIYYGAHISEVIRSGILAVSKGQREASIALGVSPIRTMMQVILPQAMRIIVPPMANYYVNITKNSALGIAIGYPDLMATTGGTSLNLTGQAIECLVMVMATYCFFNLLTALLMNYYNKKVSLVRN